MHCAIFVYVWPEPRSSAAGVRTVQLCEDLRALGYEVTALSPCRPNEASSELEGLGIRVLPCPMNDSSVESIFAQIPASLVVYDRFVMEEQMGWRARAAWPNALHVVDTQDLHSVRRARERLLAAGRDPLDLSAAEWSPDLEREMSALHRADACFVVSPWEREWLIAQGYSPARVVYLPWSVVAESHPPSFDTRADFAFLGNFRHAPNLDSVHFLVAEIWPQIRAKLPSTRLFLYGAYPPASISQLHGKNGIEVAGSVKLHRAALQKHRVLLAPLRFGAGIKGKILEAWATGTAVLGSAVAVEGLSYPAAPGDFATAAVRLHEEESAWLEARAKGFEALRPFDYATVRETLTNFLATGRQSREAWRAELTGRMLRHHLHNSTKYFSQWIEAKNRKA